MFVKEIKASDAWCNTPAVSTPTAARYTIHYAFCMRKGLSLSLGSVSRTRIQTHLAIELTTIRSRKRARGSYGAERIALSLSLSVNRVMDEEQLAGNHEKGGNQKQNLITVFTEGIHHSG